MYSRNSLPLVTVIVPAYNHEKYIGCCLESIMAQDYQNIELLICDDCSTDNTYKVALQYKERLNNVLQFVNISRNKTNCGVVKNINSMIEKANGKYIKSIASDDMLMPNAISNLVYFYENHSEYDFVFSNAVYCNENAKYPCKAEGRYAYDREPDLSGNLMQKLYEDNFIEAPTGIFKKDTFDKFGLFDEKLKIEDWEYWLRIAERGKIGYNDKVNVAYRVITTSLSHFSNSESGHKRLENMYTNQRQILQKYRNCNLVNPQQAYSNMYRRMMHEAIDISHTEMINRIVNDAAEDNISFDIETKLKYVAYRLHVLCLIQGIKRILGMETVDKNKNKK